MLEVLGIAVAIVVVFFAVMFFLASAFYVAGSAWTRGKVEALNAAFGGMRLPEPSEPESEPGE